MPELGQSPRVAYFSMEIALDSAIPTYSGGLGVLAGDLMRTAADLALPVLGVTLVSRRGYVRQEILGDRQLDAAQPWEPADVAERLTARAKVTIEGRDVWVGAWRWSVASHCASGESATVLLLDTDLPMNEAQDRRLTDDLYGGDDAHRLKQEIVLGIGGVRMLQALGVPVLKYHLNEGHAALLGLELLRQQTRQAGPQAALEELVTAVRRQCVFTTHTPVAAGHDQFPYGLVRQCLGDEVDPGVLPRLAGEATLNMTLLALNLSGWVNGVAERHAEVSRGLFPGYVVHAITNGVHAATWASDRHRALYDHYIPRWRHEPELLVQARRIPDDALLAAHAAAKAALLRRIDALQPQAGFTAERLTLGFARRMTAYKRPHLLLEDASRLRRIAQRHPIQLVFAGKAHPRDMQGKKEIERIHADARSLAGDIPVAFLPDYDMAGARLAVAGCDVWLNTPLPPLEASGTSGMKAAMNGVPSLSVLDGWWVEGCIDGVTGWAIGDGRTESAAGDAAALYERLEHDVAPLFYRGDGHWTELMRGVISRNGALFNSHRMLRRYMLEAYSR